MWHNIFALGVSVGEKVIRSVLIYLFLLIAFRVFGKLTAGVSKNNRRTRRRK